MAWEDPIVTEVRKVREELFAAAGYDLEVFCNQLRERERTEKRPPVARAPRKPGQDGVEVPGARRRKSTSSRRGKPRRG